MTIDLCNDEEDRITKVQIKDKFGDFQDLNDEGIYNVAMPSYLANGGDGYQMIEGKIFRETKKIWRGKNMNMGYDKK